MIKIGIIGAGFMGQTHAQCYQALTGKYDFQVTAVADACPENARRTAELFGAAVYPDGLSLINNADINTVDICLPTYLHTGQMIAAMEKGYHVLVEKPVCLTESEASELIKVRQRTGVEVMVAHCIRFWDEYAYLKGLVTGGEYGKFISGNFVRISPKPDWYWDGWGHDRKKSGSAVLDMHIHDVDFVRYLLGEPTRVKSVVTSSRDGNPEHVYALYQYPDQAVSIEGGWDYPASLPFEMSYRVKFEAATVIFNSNEKPTVTVFPEDGNVFGLEFPCNSNISSGYWNEIEYFLQTLTNQAKISNATLEDAVASLKLLIREIGES